MRKWALTALLPLFLGFSLDQGGNFFQNVDTTVPTGNRTTAQTQTGVSVGGANQLQDNTTASKTDQLSDDEQLELEIEAESPQQDDLMYQVSPDLLQGGDKIDASFQKAAIRDVIQVFAKKANLSVVVSPLVEGEVTSQLFQVPARSALRNILSAHKMYYIPDKGVLQIVTEAEYRVFAQKYLTESRVYEVRWASLRKAVVAARPYLTRGLGKLSVNQRTSRMVVTDLPQRLDQIEKILKQIEVENRQIMITARILEIEYADQTNVGSFYQIVEQNTGKNFLSARFQSVRSPISEQQGGLQITAVFDNVPFPSADSPKSIQLGLAAVGVNGEVTVVSSPRILVEENSQATIHIGQEIPYPKSSSSATGIVQSSFDFLEAGTRLVIVPRVSDVKKKKINLQLDIESSTAQLISFSDDGSLQAPQKNITRTRLTANSKSGKTLVIAGFVTYAQIDDTVGIPLLKDIPLINFLFANTVKSLVRREVAILLTANILDSRGTPVKRIYRQLSGQSEN